MINEDEFIMRPIGHIETDFPEKFGIPRQSGLVSRLRGRIVLCREYRVPDAFRGLEGFSHLWVLWGFSENRGRAWSPTVRPPRLGGNRRMGVFATRSPNRPNPIGLSCLKLESIDFACKDGPALHVLGADMVSGTPIFDIKPYVPYADCVTDAVGGFADERPGESLEVMIPDELKTGVSEEKLSELKSVLACDPRPPYQNEPDRIYGMAFAGMNVKFTVSGTELSVIDIQNGNLKTPV